MTVYYLGAGSAVGSTVTLATLIARARTKYLHDEPWEDTLSGAQTSGATTISLTSAAQWAPNDLIESVLDGELERISRAATPLASPITVKRAHDGTTAVAHSSGDVVYKNPRFRYHIINDHLSEVATNETWPHLWAISSVTLTPSPTTTDLYAITDLAYRNPIKATQKTTATVTGVRTYDAVEVVDVPASVAASGKAFRFQSFDNTTNDVTVYYQAQITPSTIPDGDIAEFILHRAVSRILRGKAVDLSTRDTSSENQKAQIAELVGQAQNFDQQALSIRPMARANLELQGHPQEVWVGLGGGAEW